MCKSAPVHSHDEERVSPRPQVESSYANAKATHRIRVEPAANLTVTCSVSNKLGEDARTITVSSRRSTPQHRHHRDSSLSNKLGYDARTVNVSSRSSTSQKRHHGDCSLSDKLGYEARDINVSSRSSTSQHCRRGDGGISIVSIVRYIH